jgi:hypothetical protein
VVRHGLAASGRRRGACLEAALSVCRTGLGSPSGTGRTGQLCGVCVQDSRLPDRCATTALLSAGVVPMTGTQAPAPALPASVSHPGGLPHRPDRRRGQAGAGDVLWRLLVLRAAVAAVDTDRSSGGRTVLISVEASARGVGAGTQPGRRHPSTAPAAGPARRAHGAPPVSRGASDSPSARVRWRPHGGRPLRVGRPP